MVRRFYITGGNNLGDPVAGATTIVDPYFVGNTVSGVFKEGFRYYRPGTEWSIANDTVSVLNGVQFALGEVIIVEVGAVQNGQICTPGGIIVNGVDPYLPDIVKCAVARVNTVFQTRVSDTFSVYYDHGIYQQVGSDRIRSNKGYLFVWLVMPFEENQANDTSYYADATCKIIIAIGTDSNYTQLQREDINFYPRLLPVYKQLIYEIKQEQKLDNSFKVEHNRRLLPYWGGGDILGPGQPNLWKDNVDCIEISNLKLKIEHIKNCTPFSNL